LKVFTNHATIQYNRALSLHGIEMQFILHHLNLDKNLFLHCFAVAARTAVMTEAVL
jgi:hypothetical protein